MARAMASQKGANYQNRNHPRQCEFRTPVALVMFLFFHARIPMHSPLIRTFPRRRSLLLGTLGAIGSLALTACGGGDDDTPHWRMPAETEPQRAVMLASLGYDYVEGWSTLDVQADMVAEILQHVRVVYLVNTTAQDDPQNNEVAPLTQALLARGVPSSLIAARLQFLKVDHAEFWVRDYGGTFLSDGAGGLQVVDFDFDGYGYNAFAGPSTRDVYEHDNDLAVRVAQAMGLPSVRSPIVCEGGNLHFNGRGLVLAVAGSSDMPGVGMLGRNPGRTQAELEQEILRAFGQRKMVWLPRNMPTDSHTVMQTPYTIAGEPVYNVGVTHIDEMVAWVDESTLLLPEITAEELAAAEAAGDTVTRIAHEVLAEAYAILSAATDQDGRALRIVRVPEPGPIVVEIGPDDAAWLLISTYS
jgi:agmatine deiminase